MISLIKIPMQGAFYHDFKFDLGLPDPAPGPKYLYYPFNHESYFKKPKLTNLNYIEKPQIYTRVDLNIPVDEINIKPELFNYDRSRDNRLTEEDEIFLGEKKLRKTSQVVQPTKITPEKINTRKNEQIHQSGTLQNMEESDEEDFDILDSVLTQEMILAQLKKIVNKSFEAASDLKVHHHPLKKDVTATNVYMMVPNFKEIDKK